MGPDNLSVRETVGGFFSNHAIPLGIGLSALIAVSFAIPLGFAGATPLGLVVTTNVVGTSTPPSSFVTHVMASTSVEISGSPQPGSSTGQGFVAFPDSYTVSETAGSGVNLSDYTVTYGGDCDSGGNVTVGNSQAHCTITNTYNTPAPTSITVDATKVVCQNESDLPAWGAGGFGPITASTAQDWVKAHPGCQLSEGWTFQYGDQNQGDAGDTLIGPASGYTDLGTTDGSGSVTSAIPMSALNGGTEFHLREELQNGYIPFTYDAASTTPDGNPVSAQFYCANDALHYDNWDFIRNPVAGDTYYCVAFNAPTPPTPEPGPFTVTINKYLDNEQATSETANSASFPMASSWNAVNLGGAGSGTYDLGTDDSYQAVTSAMDSGSSYTTSEDTSGNVVGSTCDSGDPYALVGYTTGATLADAQGATPTSGVPNFSNLTSNEYVIVWNQTCEQTPPEQQTAVVNIYKYLSDGETEAQIPDSTTLTYLFPMESTWTATNLDGGAQTSSSYQLGNDYGHPAEGMNYTASTSPMDLGANYSTHEVTTDEDSNSLVLPPTALCQPGDYKLLGYQVGDSLTDAQNAALSTSAPSFTDIQNDKYVIVVNEQCGSEPEVQTSTVTMCKMDDSDPANPLSGWTLTLKGTPADDFTLYSNAIDGANSTSLNSGTSYIATVSGTWTNSNINVADAEYASTDNWTTHVQGDPTLGPDEYDTQVNDAFVDWGPYNSAHSYEYALTPSSDGPVNFRVFDGSSGVANPDWYSDNSGSLSVDIAPGFMGTTGNNGCVTFDNVPYGTYTAGEVMQDGWSNVSGDGATVTVNTAETPEVDLVNHDNNSCTIVSDAQTYDSTDSHFAVPVSQPYNSAWTATSTPTPFDPSAIWIWGEDPATNTDVNKTEVFTRTFDITGTPEGGSIDIGADNGFILKVNGTTVVDESGEEHNYEASQNFDISSYLVTGTNVVEFDVTNFGIEGSNASNNPAGLVYQIHLPDNQCTNTEGETGTLEVKKVIVGNEDASPSDFSFDVTGSTSGTGSDASFNADGTNDMTVATDQTYSVDEVSDSDYTTTYSNSNDVEATDCNDLTITPGETTTCTITNTFTGGNGGNNPATLTIVKNTDNEENNGTFTFNVATSTDGGGTESVDVTTTDGSGQTENPITLDPGDYSVTELIPSGWNLSDVSCVYNNDSVGTSITNGEEISVDNGDSVTCTFTDTESSNVERTIVVRQGDLTTDPSTDTNSWFFYNDQTNTLDNSLGSFVDGPNTAPIGDGSAQISVTPTDGILFATLGYVGTPLSQVTSLNYSTFRDAGDPALALALQFDINPDITTATSSYDGRLVYEPYYTHTVEDSMWQTWNPMDDSTSGTNGNWWFSKAWIATQSGCSQATPCTWLQILAAYPHIGISGVTGFKAGSNWSSDFTGNVDDFVIATTDGTSATSTTYDFEPTDETPPNNPPGPNTPNFVPSNGPIFGGGGGGPQGLVLGASTSTLGSCTQYLTAFIKFGNQNDPEQVTRLQQFLNQFEGANLTVNGIYDQETLNALEAFQAKYAAEILTPWGASSPTGYVYLTTRREINIIYCDYALTFPLTAEQIAEIAAYKAEFGNGGTGNGGNGGNGNSGNTGSNTSGDVGLAPGTPNTGSASTSTETSSSTDNGLGEIGGAGAAGGGIWQSIVNFFQNVFHF